MQGVRPKKALGQHFLNDLSVARRIADTLNDCHGLPILEIGPGMGVLTRFLLDTHGADNLVLAEIDTESVEWLKTHLPQPQPRIVEGDFLRMSDRDFFPGDGPFCIIGNYPYNISSQIFFKVLDWRDRVVCCSGMLQREVARRIAAPAGNRDRGILSVLLQAWYDIEYLFTVDEGVFSPPPKVKSGVIRLRRNKVTDLGVPESDFRTVVKTAFGQRRKTLRNALKPLLPAGVSLDGDPVAGLRPEALSVDDFIALTRRIIDIRTQTNHSQQQ
ncbi:MAG: 16S rRNA (adenine(1518)-N(6)/adenine(1519)-N(6))-dimethyltransferase RsmA [Muribaculaceae bacterium]|nr:16S rRNA (adenine(1518)-N(6)/adenine(1519)-N(6))-dimethyltransferase RsmA [Muribaculaceae bacterium]